jgi:beta-aspartyl-peptidase (threonine type)
MDASVMTGEGRYAAVAVIERVRNPILVAREVLNTPHLLLAGEGATRFAHRLGFEDVVPVSEPARAKYERLKERLLSGETSGGYREFDWRKFWNFPGEIPEELREGDTVGAVARDGERGFAAALSTGGTSFTLYGRVGDVPVFGAGLYAGPVGAVACTGHGEIIIRQALARSTYERMVMGATPRQAVEASVRGFPETSSVGLIAVSNGGWAVAANRPMAYGMAGE